MNRFSRFLLLAILFPVFAFGQSAFKPGLVVDLKGDTLRGFIDYKIWGNNPHTIVFKSGAGEQNLSPVNIKFFSASVGHLAEYEGYIGPISTDNTDTYKITIGKDSSVKQDTVFLRVLQHGKHMVLFSMTDAQKVRFFIAPVLSEKPIELTYRVYWNSAEENGAGRTDYDNSFKGQLYDAAKKAGVMTPALKKDIQAITYKEEDLETIAAKINGISKSDKSKNDPIKVTGGHFALVIAGILTVIIVLVFEFANVGKR